MNEAQRTYMREYMRQWRAKYPEKWADIQARYHQRNKERRNEYIKALRKKPEHQAVNAQLQRARRISARNATPAWANDFFIKEAYRLAKLREKLCGGKWHVDHVVPIVSPLVCGLHVEHNLQVIPGRENLEKGNRFTPC